MSIQIRTAALIAMCVAGLGVEASQARPLAQTQEMQLTVLRHMTQDVLAHDGEFTRRLRFRFLLFLRPDQEPLRLVGRVRPAQDGREQHRERYEAGSVRLRELALPRAVSSRLTRMVRASGRGHRGDQGSITFQCGQIRWDGKSRAIVEGSVYNTGIHGACSLEGYSYQLQKVSGHWRVLGRHATAAAG